MLNGINLLIRNLILAAFFKLLNTNIDFGVSILPGFRTDVIVPTYVIDANIESPMNLRGYRTDVILSTYVIDSNIESPMNLRGYRTDVILSTYVINTQHTTLIATILMKEAMLIFFILFTNP